MRKFYLMLLLLLFVLPIHAQDETVITLAALVAVQSVLPSTLAADFAAVQPGYRLEIVTAAPQVVSPTAGTTAHLDSALDYAGSGDVVWAISADHMLSPEAITAGYWLDLSPLLAADAEYNAASYIPAIRDSFTYERGQYALAYGANPLVLTYDPTAFDAAELAYPTADWTVDDFASAARALAVTDSSGAVILPGFALRGDYTNRAFYRALLPDDFPNMTPSAAASVIETLAELRNEGVIGEFGAEAAMYLGDANDLTTGRRAVALPNIGAGLFVEGFAVSAGTNHPEVAYALARLLIDSVDLPVTRTTIPANRALIDDAVLSPDISAAVEGAAPASAIYFMERIDGVIQQVTSGALAALDAVATAQADVQTALETAAARQDVVVLRSPAPAAEPGQIALGYRSWLALPNQHLWEDAVADFSTSHPGIEATFSTYSGGDVSQYDCVIQEFGTIEQINGFLPLGPLMAADLGFDRDDFYPVIMDRVTAEDGQVYGLPLFLDMNLLRYRPEAFEQAGLPLPDQNTEVGLLVEMLRTLKDRDPDTIPLGAWRGATTHLYAFILAYGGLPVDFRTTPHEYNLMDETNIGAIRATLNLVEDGLIAYSSMSNMNGGRSFVASAGPSPLELTTVSNFTAFQEADPETLSQPLIPLPVGDRYTLLDFIPVAGLVNPASENPEGCYELLRFISDRPELAGSMPARRSALNDPGLEAAQGAERVATYVTLSEWLARDNLIPFDVGGGWLEIAHEIWMGRAFDAYLFDGTDLVAALSQAQGLIDASVVCNDPDNGLPVTGIEAHNRAVWECLVRIDETIAQAIPESLIYEGG